MTVEKLKKIRVSEIMSSEFQSVRPDATLSEAIGIMLKYDQYELPVVKKNNILSGLMSYNSLIRTGRVSMNEKVETIMLNPPKLRPMDSVARAAELLLSSDLRLLPVTKNRNLQGVIKRTKVIELSSDLETWKTLKVNELMTKNIEVVRMKDKISTAKGLMRKLDVRSLPVVDERGLLVGAIGIRDIMAYLKPKRRAQSGDFSGEKVRFDPEVHELMVTQPKFVTEEASVSQALSIMIKEDISGVFVVKERKPIGILTQYDILEYIVSTGRKQKGVLVNISGIHDLEPEMVEELFSIIDNSMNKINKIFTPKILNVHVHTHNDDGPDARSEAKYSVSMRLSTDKYLFLSKAVDWDIHKAFAEATAQLYTQVIRKKEMVKHYKGVTSK